MESRLRNLVLLGYHREMTGRFVNGAWTLSLPDAYRNKSLSGSGPTFAAALDALERAVAADLDMGRADDDACDLAFGEGTLIND